MPLDALFLHGLIHELNTALAGAKVDKIYQPGRDEVVLALRAPAGNSRLLLSANPSHPRAHLTQLSLENPDKPPMFCMLLRKHLSGARLLEITQPPLERAACFRFSALNELGDRVERQLILEAISHKANLILLDGEGRILDCVRRSEGGLAEGHSRLIQPGMFYRLPPAVDKADPLFASREDLERLLAAAPEEAQADRWLLDTFGGLSPPDLPGAGLPGGRGHRRPAASFRPPGPVRPAGPAGGAAGRRPGEPLRPGDDLYGRAVQGLHLPAPGPVRGGGGDTALPLLLPAAGQLL